MSGEDAPRPYLEDLIVLEIKTNKTSIKFLVGCVPVNYTAGLRAHQVVIVVGLSGPRGEGRGHCVSCVCDHYTGKVPYSEAGKLREGQLETREYRRTAERAGLAPRQSNSGVVISSLRSLQSQGRPCHVAKLTLTVSDSLPGCKSNPWSRPRGSRFRD
jgi:hypothetical protein